MASMPDCAFSGTGFSAVSKRRSDILQRVDGSRGSQRDRKHRRQKQRKSGLSSVGIRNGKAGSRTRLLPALPNREEGTLHPARTDDGTRPFDDVGKKIAEPS